MNLDKKHTTPILDLEKLFKPKGYLRQTYALVVKVYQPKDSQVKVNISEEEVSLVDFKETHHVKSPSIEASTSILEVNPESLEIKIPKVKLYDLKGWNFQNTPFNSTCIYDCEIKE